MLMMPLMPSGLYLAEGLVINSTFLIAVEGICCKSTAAGTLLGLPSIKIRTFSLPRKLMFPVWLSTETDCTLFNNSDAVAPAVVKSLPTLMTFRSIFCTTEEVSATTTTSFNSAKSSDRYTFPKSIFCFSELISIFSVQGTYPIKVTST